MDLQFKGCVVVITGGASGLGAATAALFAEEGASVVIADRDLAPAQAMIQSITCAGGDIMAIEVDLRDAGQTASLFKRVKDRFGALHYAVNCAGIQQQKGFLDIDIEEWNAVLDVNLRGLWLCMQEEIELMIAGDGGAIVNVASTAGLRAFPLLSAYTASKHGVVGLTRAAAIEFAERSIRVNCICPGLMRTPMSERALAASGANVTEISAGVPMQRWGEPEEFAALAAWLCSPRAGYITGNAVPLDGGLTQY
jgi:NAD(P)-dependent dehydrogenase (short-subunit alcohol dehydrogenase family)